MLKFDLDIPRLRIDAIYNLKGNILLLPLVGSGNVAMSMKEVKSSVVTKISIRQKPEVGVRTAHCIHAGYCTYLLRSSHVINDFVFVCV